MDPNRCTCTSADDRNGCPLHDNGEPIDYDQYADVDVLDDKLVLTLLAMPVMNRNEAGFMLHMAPKIAAHLRVELAAGRLEL